jgi:hypothetical protein
MASHQLIDEHIAFLAGRLPANAVDELADGLTETWQHHQAEGRTPAEAARSAIAEFGTTEQIVTAFVAQAPGRRIARLLLATGPIVGVCWGTSLLAAHAWNWPVPGAVKALFAITLLGLIAALVSAATSRDSYRRTRLGTTGGLGLIVLDGVMVAAVILLAPAMVWPMVVAIPASLTRIGLVLHRLPRTYTD